MSSNWKKFALADIINIIGGGTPKRAIPEYWNGNIPWLSVVDFNTDNRYVFETKESITELGLQKSSTKLLETGQLIISARGTVGALAQLYKPMAFNQSCYGLDGKEEFITNDFLYYLVKEKIKDLQQITHGGVFDTITKDTFKQIEVNIPPLPTQKKIAHILSTLDDKIELNRKMNQTLEEMASAIFKSWFVDFDPVHVKVNAVGREDALGHKAKCAVRNEEVPLGCQNESDLVSVAKELGISKEILDLFPSEFEESELGMIPKGWEWKSFGELLSKTIGGDWGQDAADEKHTEQVRIIRGTDIPDIKNLTIQNVPIRFVESKKLATRKLFDGDIVIEISGGTKNQPTGRSLYVINEMLNILDGEVEPASFCRLFRPINKEIGLVLAQHLLYIYDIGLTWNYQNQSTGISNFQTTTFLEKEFVLVPNNEILERFFSLVRPLIEKSFSVENITLQKTRDTLLPKLLSGEIDVSEMKI